MLSTPIQEAICLFFLARTFKKSLLLFLGVLRTKRGIRRLKNVRQWQKMRQAWIFLFVISAVPIKLYFSRNVLHKEKMMNGRFEWLDEITSSYFGCAALQKPLVPFFNNAISWMGLLFLQTTHNRTLTTDHSSFKHQPAKFPNKLSSTDQWNMFLKNMLKKVHD